MIFSSNLLAYGTEEKVSIYSVDTVSLLIILITIMGVFSLLYRVKSEETLLRVDYNCNDIKLCITNILEKETTSAKVGHVGIYIGNGQFIHTNTSKGVMVTK